MAHSADAGKSGGPLNASATWLTDRPTDNGRPTSDADWIKTLEAEIASIEAERDAEIEKFSSHLDVYIPADDDDQAN